ncbi:MAG: hypothetical protein U0470_06125 [Anaerolineae bacterium]
MAHRCPARRLRRRRPRRPVRRPGARGAGCVGPWPPGCPSASASCSSTASPSRRAATSWRALGPSVTAEGLAFAAAAAARWLAASGAIALVGALCRPAALVQAIEEVGLPGGLGHAVAAALVLLPSARRVAAEIRAAQRAAAWPSTARSSAAPPRWRRSSCRSPSS